MEITSSREAAMSIGELSRLTGVNIETIRYYERVEILPRPVRSGSGRRTYGANDRRMLAFIKRGRELGFSLNEVRTLLQLGAPAEASCGDVKEIASAHVADVRRKIDDLLRLEKILAETVARCTTEVAPICPILDLMDNPAEAAPRPVGAYS